MISKLASPTVCVIDDEKDDYEPLLRSLNALHVGCVHLLGTMESLPNQPFTNLRLVFLDLHLTGEIGKNAASYTANVFLKVVSITSAPILVVIWSKYANDRVGSADTPLEDQQTESELFKQTLLKAKPEFTGRIIFAEMSKPKLDDRAVDWAEKLEQEISNSLQGQSAIELLWEWDDFVRDASAKVVQDMTAVAQRITTELGGGLKDALKATMQRLAKVPSTGDFSATSAPKHLLTALTQLLVDQLENPSGVASFATHGTWLEETPLGTPTTDFAGRINGLLLTSDIITNSAPYAPGTVFRITNPSRFAEAFGKPIQDLVAACFGKDKSSPQWPNWESDAKPILIELSPVCDLAQGHSVSSLLVGGLVVPASYKEKKCTKGNSDAFGELPKLYLRWPTADFQEQDAILLYCHRYKLTLPAAQGADWLTPWFRIRDLPLAAIRNSNASHAARIGYISVPR